MQPTQSNTTALPTPLGPFMAQLHVESVLPDAEDDAVKTSADWCSSVLAELWFPFLRGTSAVLAAPSLSSGFPTLAKVGAEAVPELFAGAATVGIPRRAWIDELRALEAKLYAQQTKLFRYFFAPLLPVGTPQPLYSRCTLRTGKMVAGFDLCRINRNWDGIDRLEDLTPRDVFTDASGDIAIVRRSLATHLNEDIARWADILERQTQDTLYLTLSRFPQDPDEIAWELLQRAERWRQRRGLPDYAPSRIAAVNERWDEMLLPRQSNEKEAVDVGAYVGEMIRALWGGHYVQGTPPTPVFSKPPEPAPKRSLWGAKPKQQPPKSHGPLPPESSLLLQLPFDCEVAPIAKAVHARRQRRKVNWGLQLEVLGAQRRQRGLLLRLGQYLFQPDHERRFAALRLLAEVQDGRIDRLLVEALGLPDVLPAHAMHMLERLAQSRMRVPAKLLVSLAQGEHVGVAARALRLLGRQGFSQLPDLLAQRLAGKGMMALRPLARQLLTAHGQGPKQTKDKKEQAYAKKVLRSLGPIPPATTPEQLLPSPPAPLLPLPMLSELLEDSANPARHEAAISLLVMYPNCEEEETLGLGMADPDPAMRRGIIGLLAACDRPMALQLLQTRALFESDPLCRTLLQSALTNQARSTKGAL